MNRTELLKELKGELKDKRVVFLPPSVYRVFENCCTPYEKYALLYKGLSFLLIGEFAVFECDNAKYDTDNESFRELRELQENILKQRKELYMVMKEAAERKLSGLPSL